MPDTPFSWKKPPLAPGLTVPGHTFTTPTDRIWHRALWANEATFALCSFLQPGFSDIICSCQLSLANPKQPLSTHHIRSAVCHLRFERPAIASRLAWPTTAVEGTPDPEDARLIYEGVTSEADISFWADEVVFDRSDVVQDADGGDGLEDAVALVINDVCRGYRSQPTTLFNVYYISSSDSGAALVVRGSHALFDAFGLMECMNRLVELIATYAGEEIASIVDDPLAWGTEVCHLVGSGVDYTCVPYVERAEERDSTMTDSAMRIAKGIKVTPGIRVQNPNASPNSTAIITRTLRQDALKNLLLAIRFHGCKLYPTLVATMALSILRVNPPTQTNALSIPILFTPVNLRRKGILCKEEGILSALGCNTLVAELGATTGYKGAAYQDGILWEIAKEIGKQIDEQTSELTRVAIWAHDFTCVMRKMLLDKGKKGMKGAPPAVTPRVSSLGIVDPYLAHSHKISGGGLVTVSKPVITVCVPHMSPIMGAMIGLHCFTWHGTLYACFSFPDGFMGSLDEQRKSEGSGDWRSGSVMEWVDVFMGMLSSLK